MKILFVSNMYPSLEKPYSGIFIQNQYENLKESINISIHYLRSSDTNLIGSILKYIIFYFKFFPFLLRKYDIIHVHFFGYHSLLAILYKLLRPNTRIIVTFHGSDSKNLSNLFFQWMIRKFDKHIAVGLDQSEYILKNSPIKTIEIKPAGIDKSVFFRRQSRSKDYDFIFVGNFFEQKGVDLIINSIKNPINKELSFCFVGNGYLESELNGLINHYKVKTLKNQNQNQIRELLNKSKFLILPSKGDSFGLVVTEALFCGTPVIISNIGGMKDQVIHGFNGYILPENTEENLTEYMQISSKLSEKDYKKLSSNAENSNQEYSLEFICSDLIKYYKSICLN